MRDESLLRCRIPRRPSSCRPSEGRARSSSRCADSPSCSRLPRSGRRAPDRTEVGPLEPLSPRHAGAGPLEHGRTTTTRSKSSRRRWRYSCAWRIDSHENGSSGAIESPCDPSNCLLSFFAFQLDGGRRVERNRAHALEFLFGVVHEDVPEVREDGTNALGVAGHRQHHVTFANVLTNALLRAIRGDLADLFSVHV